MLKSLIAVALLLSLTACERDATVISRNLSEQADSFEVTRRIVFYNGISGEYILTIQGLCSLTPTENKLDVICKVGPTEYKKHSLGISDNVTWFSEQIVSNVASPYQYTVVFKPQLIVPVIDIKTTAVSNMEIVK
jgi:hypothetical protein